MTSIIKPNQMHITVATDSCFIVEIDPRSFWDEIDDETDEGQDLITYWYDTVENIFEPADLHVSVGEGDTDWAIYTNRVDAAAAVVRCNELIAHMRTKLGLNA